MLHLEQLSAFLAKILILFSNTYFRPSDNTEIFLSICLLLNVMTLSCSLEINSNAIMMSRKLARF